MEFAITLFAVALLVLLPSRARADDRWGISIWGLSYHVDRSVDYNEDKDRKSVV